MLGSKIVRFALNLLSPILLIIYITRHVDRHLGLVLRTRMNDKSNDIEGGSLAFRWRTARFRSRTLFESTRSFSRLNLAHLMYLEERPDGTFRSNARLCTNRSYHVTIS